MTPLEHLGLAIGIVTLIIWWIFHDAWHSDSDDAEGGGDDE